jgi:hypothetical protein
MTVYSVLNERTNQNFSVLTNSKDRFLNILFTQGIEYADFTSEQLIDIVEHDKIKEKQM